MSDLTTRQMLRDARESVRLNEREMRHLLSRMAARIEALEAEIASYRENFPCDGGCNPNSGPAEECSLHGRGPSDLWQIIGRVMAERAARDAVIAEAQQEVNGLMDSLDDSVIADDDERARVYEALRAAWTILTAPLSRVPQGAAELSVDALLAAAALEPLPLEDDPTWKMLTATEGAAESQTPEPPRMNGETTVASGNASGFNPSWTIFDDAWRKISGRDDLWGGCARRGEVLAEVERMRTADQRTADRETIARAVHTVLPIVGGEPDALHLDGGDYCWPIADAVLAVLVPADQEHEALIRDDERRELFSELTRGILFDGDSDRTIKAAYRKREAAIPTIGAMKRHDDQVRADYAEAMADEIRGDSILTESNLRARAAEYRKAAGA